MRRLFISLLLLLAGCVNEVNLPIRQVDSRLVVEGLITDEKPPYTVKLSFSGQYNSSFQLPEGLTVNGAFVTMSDDAGHTVQLHQDPLAPAFYFMRDSTFRGQVGRRYSLRIQLEDGRQYRSTPELLTGVPPIDSLTAVYVPSPEGLPVAARYRVLLTTQDPSTADNFYRWSAVAYSPVWSLIGVPTVVEGVQLDACLRTTEGPLTDVLSDALINGNRVSRQPVLDAPIYATGRHYIEVKQYSISLAAYQYWTRFEQQRTRTGSLFDAQPASIEGNVQQQADTTLKALGYFGASAVRRKRLIIPGDTINYNRFIIRYGGLFKLTCSVVPSDAELANWLLK